MSDPKARVTSPLIRLLTLWAWLPILLYLILTGIGLARNPDLIVEPTGFLMTLLNLAFRLGVGVAVAYVAAGAYLRGGMFPALALGCGMLAMGVGSTIAVTAFSQSIFGPNAGITMHNLAVLLAGVCLLIASGSILFPMALRLSGSRLYHVVVAYLGVLLSQGLCWMVVAGDVLSNFFVEGHGPTGLRQFILGISILEFVLAGVFFWQAHLLSRFTCFRWYAVGLLLFAVGLTVIVQEQKLGSLATWAGRWGQFLGGAYIFGGIVRTAREARARGLSVGQVFAVSLLQAALPYRSLVDSTSEAVVALDAQEAILYWNEAARRRFGYDAAQLFGVNLFERIVPSSQVEATRAVLASLSQRDGGTPMQGTLELELEDREGRQFPAEVAFYGNPATYGYPTVCVIRDITERTQAERALRRLNMELEARVQERTEALADVNAALRESEQRYRGLVELAPDAVLVHQDAKIVYANAAALRLYGAESFEQLRSRNVLDLVRPDERERARVLVRRAQEGGTTPVRELSHVRLDGQTVPVEATAAPVDWQGKPAVQVIIRDVSERKQLEAALRESDERLAYALLAAQEGVWDWNVATNAVYYSPRWKEMLGYEADEIEPHISAWERLLHPDDREQAGRVVASVLRGERDYEMEFRLRHKEGQYVHILSRGFPIRRETGGPIVRIVGIHLDLTERKQAEEALRNVNADLERKVTERTAELADVNALLQQDITERKQVEEALRERSEQLRMLASELTLAEERERRRVAEVLHGDLQQLLVSAKVILSPLDGAADPVMSRSGREATDLIRQAIQCSRSLTEELSPPILHRSGLIPALQWLARWMQEKHGLKVELTTSENVHSENEHVRVLLFQAVRELLFNVVKHTQVKTARVRVDRRGGQIQIAVWDDGVGFDPVQLDAIGGRAGGLGLFSIRERLELLGGRMEFDGAPGKGSRFTLWVPRDGTRAAGQTATTAAPLRGEPSAGTVGVADTPPSSGGERKIRVLVVDDHLVVRQGLVRMLREEPDIDVVGEAADGRNALALTRQLLPDVVTMDIEMPVMNGIQATRLIHPELPSVQVFGLSEHGAAEQDHAMREAGAVDYLSKIGPVHALIAAIRACCAAGSVGREKAGGE